MVYKEIANYDFILPSKTCQRHFDTTVANVWELAKKPHVNRNVQDIPTSHHRRIPRSRVVLHQAFYISIFLYCVQRSLHKRMYD